MRFALLLVAICVSMSASSVGAVASTPVASTVDPTVASTAHASRDFKLATLRLTATLSVGFQVDSLSTVDRGKPAYRSAIPTLADRCHTSRSFNDASGLKPASIRKIGDERVAVAGSAKPRKSNSSNPSEVQVAIVLVRVDELIWAGYGVAFVGDPL